MSFPLKKRIQNLEKCFPLDTPVGIHLLAHRVV